jgi:Lrp/AsnC family transcriptional regulator for asnA, asnC and gidA
MGKLDRMTERPPLDPVERQILAELQQDGRISTNALAKRVGVSEVTARRKLRRLLGEDIVRVVGAVDPFDLGLESPALVGIKVDRARLDDVAQTLSRHPAVRYVAAATGAFHLYIEVMAATNMQLSEFLLDDLGAIPGILDTETSLILRIYKDAPASDASLEALAAGEEPAARSTP